MVGSGAYADFPGWHNMGALKIFSDNMNLPWPGWISNVANLVQICGPIAIGLGYMSRKLKRS